ncbi:hypothetical protein [Pseudoalteromonas tunicata]|uniref:hypothetical protein n=1 Tax=Pseudoalteromonas tunicata TaxID=314281 RepID=UPI00273E0721|nr:hypothetical protein [Pseudoalteromonas tunicata]MDP4985341.1 hypothetical protein [Pseudoalteromonas tunicata]
MGHKPINMKPLAMVGLLAASSLVNAAPSGDNIFTVSFTTAPAATVKEIDSLNFGNKMGVAAGTTCTMTATLGVTAGLLVAGDYFFGGEQCGAPATPDSPGFVAVGATVGRFELSGLGNQQVKIALKTATDEFLEYTPAGQYLGGSFTVLTETAPVTGSIVALNTASQTVTLAPLKGLVQGSTSRGGVGTIIVSGVLKSLQKLETSKPYTLDFTLDVTYL